MENYKPMQDFIPESTYDFEEFKLRPIHPFSRLDKIIKSCDYTKLQQGSKLDDDFILGQKVVKKSAAKRFVFVQQQQAQSNTQIRSSFDHSQMRRNKHATQTKKQTNIKKTKFKDSISIQADWITITETQKQLIDKTPISLIESKQLFQTGTVKRYNTNLDRVRPNFEKRVEPVCEDLASSSTREDKYLVGLIEKHDFNDPLPTVYTTDLLLFSVLTLRSSVYPWDIMVTKKGNQLIFDKANQHQNKLTYPELFTVNENTTGDMPEEEKDVSSYCLEATVANANWQIIGVKGMETIDQVPTEEYLFSENFAYSYLELLVRDRIEKVSKNEDYKPGQERFKVVVRTTIEAVNQNDENLLIKSFSELETPFEWRQSLITKVGEVTTRTMINNLNNIARWLCHAQLIDCNQIKIGYLSRQSPKDDNKHSLLLVETYSQQLLASQINFKQTETWQNLRHIVEYLLTLEDGQYCLLKQSYKQSIRIFRIEEEDEDENQQDG